MNTQTATRPHAAVPGWLGLALIASLGGACASEPLGGKEGGPVILPKSCRQGPHCVTGQVTDQWATPVEGAAISVIGEKGEGYSTTSDKRGFFYLDKLPLPPKQVRVGKTGFETQLMPLPPKPAEVAAPLYVVIRKIGDGDCTCSANALIEGKQPCPPEQCK